MVKDLSKKIVILEPEPVGEMVKKLEDVFRSTLKHRQAVWYEWRDQFEESVVGDGGSTEPKDNNHRAQGGGDI